MLHLATLSFLSYEILLKRKREKEQEEVELESKTSEMVDGIAADGNRHRPFE
jgi:hypothetical protein